MTIWFGRPGAQISIPDPRNGVESTRVRPTSSFATGNGGARSARVLNGKRSYSLNWQRLWYDTYYTIEGYQHGHEGPGPFVLHDPGRINFLTVNQSGATSLRNDTDGFSVSASGHSLASSSSTVYRGPRCLEWNTQFAVSGAMTLTTPTPTWYGIPCLASQPLVFSAQVRGFGAVAVANVAPTLSWYTSTGTLISTTTGGTVVTSSGAWQQATVTATPPATAVYVLPGFNLTGNSAGYSVHLDVFQLQNGSTPTAWRPGTGIFPVQVISLTEKWPWSASDYRENATLVLQEVGP